MKSLRATLTVTLFLTLLFGLTPSFAQTTDYTELSLEELSAVRIFTLGRKQATLFDTPNAAAVVTGEDLHRAGALDLAEALRIVPGVQVSRIDSFNYGISIRGFNDPRSSKLLVLMDGRSLYSTTSTGAYWNYHELILEDVDRIEVLRGPGASLWGANAVNGVINIVTKPADATLGSLFSIASGDELETSVALREGVRLNPSTALRVYGKFQDHDNYGVTTDTASGGWSNSLIGARLDWQRPGGGALTVIGEAGSLRVKGDPIFPSIFPPYYVAQPGVQRARGGNLSAHWVQPAFGNGEISILGTYELFDNAKVDSGEDRSTYGIDFQVTLHPGTRQEIITGATFRADIDDLTQSPWVTYHEPHGRTYFTGVFLQDEITILPDRLLVTAGSKFERNSFTGWETQPSLRAILRTTKNQRSWIGISRAARTPSREEREIDVFGGVWPPQPGIPLPIAIHAVGSHDLDSEHVTAFEFGHRYEPNPHLSFDLALFYNRFTDLRATTITEMNVAFAPVPHIEEKVLATNNLYGSARGADFSVRWQPVSSLKIEGSVAAVRTVLHEYVPGNPPDLSIEGLTGSTPKQEYKLRIAWDPLPEWSFDIIGHRFGRLPGPQLPAYTGLDARIAWHAREYLEIELVGRELLDPMHGELSKNFIGPEVRETSRSFFLRMTYRH